MFSQLLTASELATRLRISPARLYELVRQGLVPVVRIGRQVRFDPAAVEAWIAGGGRSFPGGWRRVSDDGASTANARSGSGSQTGSAALPASAREERAMSAAEYGDMSSQHVDRLRASAVTPEAARARGYRTVVKCR
jgi:excisionase family DNA binding protein